MKSPLSPAKSLIFEDNKGKLMRAHSGSISKLDFVGSPRLIGNRQLGSSPLLLSSSNASIHRSSHKFAPSISSLNSVNNSEQPGQAGQSEFESSQDDSADFDSAEILDAEPTPVVALADFEAGDEAQLSLREGEQYFMLKEEYGNGWSYGCTADGLQRGIFPSTYTQKLSYE